MLEIAGAYEANSTWDINKEKEVVIGMTRTEERINLDALAYNLIRLHNIKQEIKNTTEDLEDFCESTSIKNQLKLDVTIF